MNSTPHLPLARKWRPEQFDDVVGQDQVVRVLSQSIIQDRLHHAYLLTGTRGIGKTSLARIFSKAIRCTNRTLESSRVLSCGVCSECVSIAKGQSLDVLEIDGASNNGVDAIRELRENARFLPSSGSKKIFLIDEVHMLTPQAFNAILKTLEEPPEHVLFLFATTEPQRILPTILSRCQKLDLKRVSDLDIAKRLRFISEREEFSPEDGALELIAKHSDGSLRDALSQLDQTVSFGGMRFTRADVESSLGLIDDEKVFAYVSCLLKGDISSGITRLNDFYYGGLDLRLLSKRLVETFYELTLAAAGISKPRERSEKDWQTILELSKKSSLDRLEIYFQAAVLTQEQTAKYSEPRHLLAVLAIKIGTDVQSLNTAVPVSSYELKKIELVNTTASQKPEPASPSPIIMAQPPSPEVKLGGSYADFVEFVRKRKPMLASLLDKAACDQWPVVKENAWVIAFADTDYEFYHSQLNSKQSAEYLNNFTSEFLGFAKRPEILRREVVQSSALVKEEAEKKRIRSQEELALSHPVLIEAQKVFGAKLSPIEWQKDSLESVAK